MVVVVVVQCKFCLDGVVQCSKLIRLDGFTFCVCLLLLIMLISYFSIVYFPGFNFFFRDVRVCPSFQFILICGGNYSFWL